MKTTVIMLAVMAAAVSVTQAALVTAGELVVDLRNTDLSASSTTWVNNDTTGDTVGDFTTRGGGTLKVIDMGGGLKAVDVANVYSNALISALNIPSSLSGNNSRSVEAWVYVTGNGSWPAVASWGSGGNSMSSFEAVKLFSGWNNDLSWADRPINHQGEWLHLAWTYDGTNMKGYINGVADANSAVLPNGALTTSITQMGYGARYNATTANVHDGYIADFRVHTGALSATDVAGNYAEGMYAIPEPATISMIAIMGGGLLFIRRRFMI